MENIELLLFAVAALLVVVVLLRLFPLAKNHTEGKMYDAGLRDYDYTPEEIEQQRMVCQRLWFILYGSQDYPMLDLSDDEVTDRYEGMLLSLYTCRGDRDHVLNYLRKLYEKDGALSKVDDLILSELRD